MEYQEPDVYQQFRAKVQRWIDSQDARNSKWAEYLMYAPDLFHLLVRLSLDEDVPSFHKVKLVAVIGYFISPFDVLPEFVLGPLGLLDDIALAAWVLNTMVNEVDPQLVRKYWAGKGDSLEVIQRILASADEMIGSGLWERLKKKFE
ncbi:MAG: YkvA family protein [Syntrophomonadales bacterium]